jgi:hypothetical protein
MDDIAALRTLTFTYGVNDEGQMVASAEWGGSGDPIIDAGLCSYAETFAASFADDIFTVSNHLFEGDED